MLCSSSVDNKKRFIQQHSTKNKDVVVIATYQISQVVRKIQWKKKNLLCPQSYLIHPDPSYILTVVTFCDNYILPFRIFLLLCTAV